MRTHASDYDGSLKSSLLTGKRAQSSKSDVNSRRRRLMRKTHDHDTYTRVRQQAAKAARWWCFSASRAHESCWGMCKKNKCELYMMFWDNLGNGLLMVFEVVSSGNFFFTSPEHFTTLCFLCVKFLNLRLPESMNNPSIEHCRCYVNLHFSFRPFLHT